MRFQLFFILFSLANVSIVHSWEKKVGGFFGNNSHTNNWAVLVAGTPGWFEYHHGMGVLALYQHIKRLGIPDSQIIVILTDQVACNPRNSKPATIYGKTDHVNNLFPDMVDVDYRGDDATVQNFMALLSNRLPKSYARSKRLATDHRSNVLIYITSHGYRGGVGFNGDHLTHTDLASLIDEMWMERRYNELLLIVDACYSGSMYKHLRSPNVFSVTSSLASEKSFGAHEDKTLGVNSLAGFHLKAMLDFLEPVDKNSDRTLKQFADLCPNGVCGSTPGVRQDLFPKNPESVPITNFFGQKPYIDFLFDIKFKMTNSKFGKVENVSKDFDKVKSTDGQKDIFYYTNLLPW